MNRFTFRKYTNAQRKRREAWWPRYEDGRIVNGCLEADDYDEAIVEELLSSSVSISTAWSMGDMPVVKWDADFELWLRKQQVIHDTLRNERTQCTLPWQVLKHLPEPCRKGDALYYSQGAVPSCMGHAHAFAQHNSMLTQIALGAPLVYDPFNAIVAWAISKGGSTRGGQSPGPMAKSGNQYGNFPISVVGADSTRLPSYKQHAEIAQQYQSGIAFIPGKNEELARNIMACCRSGLGVACGNSTAVRGATTDGNGVKVAVLGGLWAHATGFTNCRTVKNTEYVFWVNSHGKRYGSSDEGEPADGAWMPLPTLVKFCTTMTIYGQPYAILPESPVVTDNTLGLELRIPFPANWKG